MSNKINHIAIAGNIGAGKSTLTSLLSKQYGWHPQFEDVENIEKQFEALLFDDLAKFEIWLNPNISPWLDKTADQ